jgi:phenylalanyl-tRNA synthetase beta chain
MYSIRRTSMALGLFTDAVTRFNKGQSPLQNLAVLAKIVSDVERLAGGEVAGEIIDERSDKIKEMLERGSVHQSVSVTSEFINARLGLNLSAEEIKSLLENVEFKATLNKENHTTPQNSDFQGGTLEIEAPFWRTDIEIPEDIVEEVGRLYGYNKLPLDLPKRDLTPAPKDPLLELKAKIRNTLSKAGANEVLTYSFVHGNLLEKVGQDRNQAFQIANALSPDLQYYRLSLTPSLLEKIHSNIKAGHDEFALFEIGKVHGKALIEDDGLPKEFDRVAFVFAAGIRSDQKYEGAAYYQACRYLLGLLSKFDLANVTFEPINGNDSDQATKYYELGRAATIKLGDVTLGRIGEYSSSVRRALKLPDFVAGFELGLAPILTHAPKINQYIALPRFPKVEQDICLKVPADMKYRDLSDFVAEQVINEKPENSQLTTTAIDNYQREDDKSHKQITLRISIASYERTLTDAEVSKILDHIAAAAKERFSAERV